MALALVPTIQNPDAFLRISNGWASKFQIPFKIWVVSCDLIPIVWVMLLVHMSILLTKQKESNI